MSDKMIKSRRKKLSIGWIILMLVSIFALVFIVMINAYVQSSVKDKMITVGVGSETLQFISSQ